MQRVSEQRYADIKEFYDDFTLLVNTCIAGADRRGVLDALTKQVVVTGGGESKRLSKGTFQGFPHPLLEEMMAQASAARKKIPPGGTVHVTVDVGRYLARAYGLGLSAGARFCGVPSQEKAFYAQRKKREAELANSAGSKVSVAALKAQKKNKAKEKSAEPPKKKQKLQQPLGTPAPAPAPAPALALALAPASAPASAAAAAAPAVVPKVNRSLRATRRTSTTADDSAEDLHHRSSVSNHHLPVPDRRGLHRRICRREKVHCHHLQGHEIEMCDPDYTGFKYIGTLQGTKVACHCGCERTLPATHWLMHNGGRAKSRNPGYPWKFMRLVQTKTKMVDHFAVCDCHDDLCDTCRSWEAPGAPIVSCWRCRTSIHATEECAIRVVPHEDGLTAPMSPGGATADQDIQVGATPAPDAQAEGTLPNMSAAINANKQGGTGEDGYGGSSNLAVQRSASGGEEANANDIVSKTLLSRGDDYGASSNLAVRRSSSGSASGGGDCGNGGSGDVGVEANSHFASSSNSSSRSSRPRPQQQHLLLQSDHHLATRARGGVALGMSTASASSAAASSMEGAAMSAGAYGSGVLGEDLHPPSPSTVGEATLQAKANANGKENTLARLVPFSEPWLTEAGHRLRAGKLVAFPTETVYGLGANALSKEAVLRIFKAKQRPLTDPLIVHVPDTASALAVVDFEGEGGGGDKARRLMALLGEKLWPGPLTLILKAAAGVPDCITAGTGFVGVRCPAHPATRQLLSLAGVPVAAPSANRFGHVSPTQAVHVMKDLGESDILVLDGDKSGACGVGIESTVAKIDIANDRILILRMGGVTQDRLREALVDGGEDFSGMSVHAGSVAGGKAEVETRVATEGARAGGGALLKGNDEPAEAEGQAPALPGIALCVISGQLLRHYSPDLEVLRVVGATKDSTTGRLGCTGERANLLDMARTSVVVDYAGQLLGLKSAALAYSDLSVKGDPEEAAEGLFRALRWAEGQPEAERLLIAGLPRTSSGDLSAAVNDRIYRSASGKTISAE
eukprot:jgi/Undpi1/8560/HiC_scaffold_25.g11025.m1